MRRCPPGLVSLFSFYRFLPSMPFKILVQELQKPTDEVLNCSSISRKRVGCIAESNACVCSLPFRLFVWRIHESIAGCCAVTVGNRIGLDRVPHCCASLKLNNPVNPVFQVHFERKWEFRYAGGWLTHAHQKQGHL